MSHHHDHHHSHSKKHKTLIYILALGLALVFYFLPQNSYIKESIDEQENYKATVNRIVSNDPINALQTLEVEITDKDLAGQSMTIVNDEGSTSTARNFLEGDRVVVTQYTSSTGENIYYISDYLRQSSLLWLFLIFIVVAIIVTRFEGIGALLGMAFSFLVLFKFILPQILGGSDPIFSVMIGAAFIIPVTFYLSHGFSRKTNIAIFSTLLTLVVTSILALIFAKTGNLTGLASEEASFLQLTSQANINFQGLVLAGMILSTLGILDDVTISQASIVQELIKAKPSIKFRELYKSAMNVGRDHIASLINTLILVYTGASLPLLLLFLDHSQSFTSVINHEFMAEEVIRTLVGSLGLILAVPITTFLSAFINAKKSAKKTA